MAMPLAVPAPASSERVHLAVVDRPRTDYEFHFWTAFGWTLLTFGIYSIYVFYQLVRRSRDHNRRRVMLLGAATEVAWDWAVNQGRADEMRPRFDQVSHDVEQLRAMDGDMRDPVLWTLLSVIGGGIVWAIGAVLLDQDLVRHERHERAAEAGLTSLLSDLGVVLPTAAPVTKHPHNYVGRVVAIIVTFGVYSLWWVADIMREGNANYVAGYAWEDALAASIPDTADAA